MVIRVSVDAEAAGALVPLLVKEIKAERICFEPALQQVCVEVEKSPDQALVRVLNLVEKWLGDGGRAPTNVEIDDHRYVLGGKPAGAAV